MQMVRDIISLQISIVLDWDVDHMITENCLLFNKVQQGSFMLEAL